MDKENNVNPQIAGAFAGGIGNTGSVCGAVVGAVMAIGLRLGKKDTIKESLNSLEVARDFRNRFEMETGSINCRELTGLDLTKEEDLNQLMNSEIPRKVCFPAVGKAYEIAVDLLK